MTKPSETAKRLVFPTKEIAPGFTLVDKFEPCPDCRGKGFHYMGYYMLACNSCGATGRATPMLYLDVAP